MECRRGIFRANLASIVEANSAISLAYKLVEPSNKKTLNVASVISQGFEIKDKMKEIFGGAKPKATPAKPQIPPAVGVAAGAVAGAAVAAATTPQPVSLQETVDLTAKSIFDETPPVNPAEQAEIANTVAQISSDGELSDIAPGIHHAISGTPVDSDLPGQGLISE